MIVGLTGGIGSGKTTVLNGFKNFKNIAIYITDEEAKKLTTSSEKIKSQICTFFGDEAYKNGTLNQHFIADIVFNDTAKLAKLNAIIHPEVHRHFQEFITKNKTKKYILYENAILFENKSNELCDKIICVTAPLETRIQRVIDRDKTTKKKVLDRIKNQWSEEKKILQSHYVIQNIEFEETTKKINKTHNILTQYS